MKSVEKRGGVNILHGYIALPHVILITALELPVVWEGDFVKTPEQFIGS